MSEGDQVKWRGVRPTSPEGDPIPVKLEDAAGAAQGVVGNPVIVNYPVGTTVITEDSGVHSNPRKYETDHAFRSQVLTLTDGLAHALYTLTTTPARTAGESVFIYKIRLYNHGGGLATVQLEQPAGTMIGLPVAVDDRTSLNEDFPTPLPIGTTGVFARAGITVAGVDVQILGLEV